MLKTIGLPDVLVFKIENRDDEVIRFGVGGSGKKLAKKSGKLLKSRKTSKSKKLLKSRNLPKSDVKEDKPNFLTSGARKTFNCLRLVFNETLILCYFDIECHIWIETNALSYTINGV